MKPAAALVALALLAPPAVAQEEASPLKSSGVTVKKVKRQDLESPAIFEVPFPLADPDDRPTNVIRTSKEFEGLAEYYVEGVAISHLAARLIPEKDPERVKVVLPAKFSNRIPHDMVVTLVFGFVDEGAEEPHAAFSAKPFEAKEEKLTVKDFSGVIPLSALRKGTKLRITMDVVRD